MPTTALLEESADQPLAWTVPWTFCMSPGRAPACLRTDSGDKGCLGQG